MERYYTHPSCTPARSSLMTGKRALSMGTYISLTPWDTEGLDPREKLLPQYLKETGYSTWLLGKWHLGHSHSDELPQNRGFDYFYGNTGGELNYYTHLLNGTRDWQRNGEVVDEEGYVTHLLRDEALTLLMGHDVDVPFFLQLSFTAPHVPLQAPDDAIEAYNDIEDYDRRRLAAMITEMDTAIGALMQLIKNRSDNDNTLVLFISDNGGDLSSGASNGALRGSKTSPYDGGIRVPAIAWWPDKIKAGQTTTQFISVHDWLPTILAASGTNQESDDQRIGENILPVLQAGAILERDQPIVIASVTTQGPKTIMIDEGWKLIGPFNVDDSPVNISQYELYNLVEDPYEQTNLVEIEIVRRDHMLTYVSNLSVGRMVGGTVPPEDYDDGSISSQLESDNDPMTPPEITETITEHPPSTETE